MKRILRFTALAAIAATTAASAQYAPPPPPPGSSYGQQPQNAPPPNEQQYNDDGQGEEMAPPPQTAAPNNLPPPPGNVPPPVVTHNTGPMTSAPAARPLPPPQPRAGDWVYTAQYGWLWMPYDRGYTYVVDGTDTASMYVYSPRLGWRWVAAPWVVGIGPVPRWGRFGPRRFVWYSHPWFHRRVVVRRHRVVRRRHW
jgi:hypothetical protein